MSINVSNLLVNRVIIHKVNERDIDKSIVDPEYNDRISRLNGKGLMTFRQRVINAIGRGSCSLQMEIYKQDDGSTFSLIKKSISSSDEIFIENSKAITYKLAEAQNSRRLPAGIVVIFDGTIGPNNNSCLGIIKAEPQEGFKLEGLSLDFIENLILTKSQKLYKIGLFIKNNEDDYSALIYDSNLSRIDSDAAHYFYDSFLGCRKCETDKVLNKEFYSETRQFIDDLPEVSDEEKLDYNYGLYIYMNTEINEIISTRDFSERYFNNDLRLKYLNHMKEKGIPNRNISKDISLIESTLKNRKINFTNDIQLVAPSNKFKENVEIKKESDKTIVTINGSIVKQL